MHCEWEHKGSVRLKRGSTLQDVLNLYPCEDEPHLPLSPSGEVELENGHVWLKVEAEFLEYAADGDSFRAEEDVAGFLQAIADELAADGWIDYEIDDFEVPLGPNEMARAKARLGSAQAALSAAQHELTLAEAEVRRLQEGQP